MSYVTSAKEASIAESVVLKVNNICRYIEIGTEYNDSHYYITLQTGFSVAIAIVVIGWNHCAGWIKL